MSEFVAPRIPDKGFVGTVKRTWLERDNRRVGRFYKIDQLEQVKYIHRLCNILYESGVPVQIPITEPILFDDRFMVYYSYSDDHLEDFSGKWYTPKLTSNRLKNAARVFADFQKVATTIKGPERPLDYPYCNTVDWIYDTDPISRLLGSWQSSTESSHQISEINRLERIVYELIEETIPHIQNSIYGLCHSDFHSGNTIFIDDKIQQIVDFGFWINHPLEFDLAISLEMWARNWKSETFELDKKLFCQFLEEYLKNGGPVEISKSNMYIFPLARLWIETYGVRRQSYPANSDAVCKYIGNALKRINWYVEYIDSFV